MSSDRRAGVQNVCDRARAAAQRGDVAAALRLYRYAQRLAPEDAEVTLSIAAAYLGQHDRRAVEAFAQVAAHHDVQEAWIGLVAAHHRFGEDDLAAQKLRLLLSRYGYVRGTANIRLCDSITLIQGNPGWCALSADGRLRVALLDPSADIHRLAVLLDDIPLGMQPQRRTRDGDRRRASFLLPDAWRQAAQVSVCLQGRHLVGSPLEASVISQLEGFVTSVDGSLVGWAWFPRDPDSAPVLVVKDALGTAQRHVASDPALDVQHAVPLARPRRIEIPAQELRALVAPVAVHDASGHNIHGSPLDPLADQRSAAGAAELARRLYPASTCRSPGTIDLRLTSVPADIVGVRPARRNAATAAGIDVVIPVYRGHNQTLACIRSVLAASPARVRCIVIDDASPEAKLVEALRNLAEAGRIMLHRQATNQGFPATANAGIRLAGDRDVILLNNDTLVPSGFVERLAAAAYGAPDIGTATPLSNDATVFSYPREAGRNPVPDAAATSRLDRLARRANGKAVVEVPTAHGFCVYLRRDCLNEVGLLREDLFAQGYGEENDFSIRARHLGWRHVAVPGVFVGHAGANSFGSAKEQLLARNLMILNRLHPGYDALIADYRQADPLAPSRFRMDALRWRQRRSRKGAVVLITHSRDGGVKRRVAERCAEISASGLRPIVLAPGKGLADGPDADFPNLRFDTSDSVIELAAFLRDDKPVHVELHHFVGHDPHVLGLARVLNVPYDVVVHDYAWVCPRITLVGPDKRYCGEPGGDACEACYADVGGDIEEDIRPSRLRPRSHSVLAGARRVLVPSKDVAVRLRHYFPGVVCVVTAWENDAALPGPTDRRVSRLRLRVAVVGAIGIAKGYEYLLACARYVATQRLPVEFVVVGYTCDDTRLLDTGVVHITGRYEETEAVALIREQQAEVGFLPALWPETWSYTLSQMWQAGLDVVAFDLGAPAERILATRRGRLLPLGLPPAAACRALLAHRAGIETMQTGSMRLQAPAAVA